MSPTVTTRSATQRTRRARRVTLLGAALAASSALVATTATAASAADTMPTEQELLSQCKTTADSCKFEATSLSRGFVGAKHQVGNTVYNCGGTVHRTWSWSETTGQSTNANISATLASALWEPISVSATATFGKTFDKSHTTTVSVDYTMEPYHKAWINRGTGYQIIQGDWELHFGKRYHGHYYWYDKNYESKIEDPEGGWESYNYVTMTDAEIKSHCNTTNPTGVKKNSLTRYIKGSTELNEKNGWNYARDRGPSYSSSSS
ncbi:hypothetical protein F9278_42235 [Streptomyces phaeolivaceus]|uniref:Uncharacterized protein n=1 Tax=Streptomyces phaeolivaceus TaxID=2653200 RepID=A0A5P8KEK7_9ACTN|nr:hypothetical protein [Streptomyces phaeolivaceus]QFR01716.1 hypothetical protein F9278_42235 [Streptomyces phaeolivaceus]